MENCHFEAFGFAKTVKVSANGLFVRIDLIEFNLRPGRWVRMTQLSSLYKMDSKALLRAFYLQQNYKAGQVLQYSRRPYHIISYQFAEYAKAAKTAKFHLYQF